MVEEETNRVVSDDEPHTDNTFFTRDRLNGILEFFKLAGFNFLKISFIFAALFFLVLSFYKLFFSYGFGGEIFHIVTGRLKFSAIRPFEWGWLVVLVAAWSTFSALIGRKH